MPLFAAQKCVERRYRRPARLCSAWRWIVPLLMDRAYREEAPMTSQQMRKVPSEATAAFLAYLRTVDAHNAWSRDRATRSMLDGVAIIERMSARALGRSYDVHHATISRLR